MSGVLEGIKVIDMGHFVAIPAAAVLLADWGAEVIKVEPPSGELHRGARRSFGVDLVLQMNGGEVNWRTELHNRNKKGMAVDLRTESGRDIIYRLVKRSDVFMSNYELSTLQKFKMDYATLSQINPGLVYALNTGFGSKGPDREGRAFDQLAWSRSGAQYRTGEPGGPPPTYPPGMMDKATSMTVVAGILGALLHRERTGKGQELECCLYHAAVWSASVDIEGALMGQPLPNISRAKASSPLTNTYRTGDERWFNLSMGQEQFWPILCRIIEKPEMENDPRFNNMESREQNSEELVRLLDEIFATNNLEEWEKRFKANDFIYSRVQTPLEVTTDPQALANEFFAEIEHPIAGKMKLVNTPVKFRRTPASIRTPAPQVGQHTEEILLDLGYTWEDIAKLKDEGAIP